MYKKKEKPVKLILRSKITLFFLIIVVVFLANSSYQMYKKNQETLGYLSSLDEKYKDLQQRENNLNSNLDILNSETGIEKEIRTKFNVGREGEKAFVILEEELPPAPMPEEKNFWGKIIDFVSF